MTVLFYIFSLLLVISGVKVITARNPVASALFLVLAFCNAAALWMLLEAEFLAILLVLIYIGAVMVLFLFVVMMLDINTDILRRNFRRFVPMATVVGAIIVVETALILCRGYGTTASPVREIASGTLAKMTNTHLIGQVIYTDYIFAFEIAGLVLLVAIIAAVSLTSGRDKACKRQNVSDQVSVRRQDRVRLIKMAAEKPPELEATPVSTDPTAATKS
ncbi:MAG: NADH-quinone oxidoreductase subunit J [Burkholderia gladioli]|nr:MAG: NADH-quinone oxidoreductase subunit J [Burkholderia gladioli]